jgi:hypothetical protein
MEPFEYYLKSNLVKKTSPNLFRAKFLIDDINLRLEFLKEINIEKFPKIFFEHLYDILRDFCDAILFAEGYKSYSHEASISYLLNKGIDFATVRRLDSFRYKRNGSKYYGEPISIDDAKSINEFYLKTGDKLKNMLKSIK